MSHSGGFWVSHRASAGKHTCAASVCEGWGDVGKNGGMSRFVFLPVDSECDQLVKQRDTECGSGGGGVGWGEGGSNLFHRESLRPISESERDERKKEEKNGGKLLHNEHNDKQKDFSVISGRFPQTPNNSDWRLDAELQRVRGGFSFYSFLLQKCESFVWKWKQWNLLKQTGEAETKVSRQKIRKPSAEKTRRRQQSSEEFGLLRVLKHFNMNSFNRWFFFTRTLSLVFYTTAINS